MKSYRLSQLRGAFGAGKATAEKRHAEFLLSLPEMQAALDSFIANVECANARDDRGDWEGASNEEFAAATTCDVVIATFLQHGVELDLAKSFESFRAILRRVNAAAAHGMNLVETREAVRRLIGFDELMKLAEEAVAEVKDEAPR